MSPFLFIIMAEVIGILTTKQRLYGSWIGIKVVEGVEAVSHLQFINEIFLVGDALEREASIINKLLIYMGESQDRRSARTS